VILYFLFILRAKKGDTLSNAAIFFILFGLFGEIDENDLANSLRAKCHHVTKILLAALCSVQSQFLFDLSHGPKH